MKPLKEIWEDISELPLNEQWKLRDKLPKRPRGRPPGETGIYAIKDEAFEMYQALPNAMSDFEKLQAVQRYYPSITHGVVQSLVDGKDWRYKRWKKLQISFTRNRDYS